MVYKALRAMSVPAEGGGTRQVKPGDPVPEAANWKRLRAWIERGWITDEDGYKIDPFSGKPSQRVIGKPKAAPAKAPEPPPAPAPMEEPEEDGPLTEAELLKLSKGELKAAADSIGVDSSGTKADLVEAILAAQE